MRPAVQIDAPGLAGKFLEPVDLLFILQNLVGVRAGSQSGHAIWLACHHEVAARFPVSLAALLVFPQIGALQLRSCIETPVVGEILLPYRGTGAGISGLGIVQTTAGQ